MEASAVLSEDLAMDEPSDEVIREFFGLSSEDIAALDEWLLGAG